MPWCAGDRELTAPAFGRTELYGSLPELKERFTRAVRDADLVVVGSYVPEGAVLGPRLPRHVQRGPPAVPRPRAARSRPALAGGPVRGGGAALSVSERVAGGSRAHRPSCAGQAPWLLQPAAADAQRHARGHERGRILAECEAVRRGCLRHADRERRLDGLDNVFGVGREVLVANGAEDVLRYLRDWPEADLRAIGERARACVLASHTAAHRARELELYFEEAVAPSTTV